MTDNEIKCEKCIHKYVCEKRTCAECVGGYCDECQLYCEYDGKPDIKNCKDFVDADLINRQQAETKEWHRTAELNANEIIKLQAKIERLQLENEKLEIKLKGKAEAFNESTHYAMEVIKRQDAEIESLQKVNDSFTDIGKLYSEIKAKAIKEIAGLVSAEINRALTNNHKVKQERVSKLIERGVAYNDEFCNYCDGKIHALCGIGDFIKDLVKEMVGDDNV